MILTKDQAIAIYDAMNIVNNYGANLESIKFQDGTFICQFRNGYINIGKTGVMEEYENKKQFAQTYKLIV